MGILLTIWQAAKPYRMVARAKAGQYAEEQITSGEWDMSRIRDLKQQALTRAQRKERREQGGLFWRFSDESRPLGAAWQNWTNPGISGNAAQGSAPVVVPPNLGQRLPGPGAPGRRRPVSQPAPTAAPADWWANPLLLVAAAGAAWWVLSPKKR